MRASQTVPGSAQDFTPAAQVDQCSQHAGQLSRQAFSQGHHFVDFRTGELTASESAYEHPQPHACFIQGVDDDLARRVRDGVGYPAHMVIPQLNSMMIWSTARLVPVMPRPSCAAPWRSAMPVIFVLLVS